MLANLKDDRETGDYEAMSWIDEETARRAVEEAEGFVEAVGAYIARLLPGTPEGRGGRSGRPGDPPLP